MSGGSEKEGKWATYVGDFPMLKSFLSTKENDSPWILVKTLDAVLRGFGQVFFANNPISGFLIAAALAVEAPGSMLLATCFALLGYIFSLVSGESRDNLENGLTVFNPLLLGAVTHELVPDLYDNITGRLSIYLLFSIAFSVYITRALGSGRFPAVTGGFNIVQLVLIFTIVGHRTPNYSSPFDRSSVVTREVNLTYWETSVLGAGELTSNWTRVDKADWGMVFKGIVTSASQGFALDDAVVASVIYLAILTYSPITALFAFLGAMLGTFTGLILEAPLSEIYAGAWGFNSLLSCSAIGGVFIVLEIRTIPAAICAGIFAALVQNILTPIFSKIGLPVLTVPFLISTWLFMGLRDSVGSGFARPVIMTFPEKQRVDYRNSRREKDVEMGQPESADEVDLPILQTERKSGK